jgi:hypothetical protein
MAKVVSHSCELDKIWINLLTLCLEERMRGIQPDRNRFCDLGDLERVRQSISEKVAFMARKNLRFTLKPTECATVYKAGIISSPRGAMGFDLPVFNYPSLSLAVRGAVEWVHLKLFLFDLVTRALRADSH